MIPIGRIILLLASSAVVALAGGGLAFIQRPVGATYLALWVIWQLTIIALRKGGAPSLYDRNQRAVVITLGILVFPVLIVAPSWEYAHLSGPVPRDGPLAWAGLFLFASGILLGFSAMWALGSAFTVRLGIQPGQPLVTGGPYRVIRHPGYLSYIICLVGIGLAMSSLITLGLAVLIVPFLIWRIRREEQMLATEFGGEHERYKKQTKWRLIPRVY